MRAQRETVKRNKLRQFTDDAGAGLGGKHELYWPAIMALTASHLGPASLLMSVVRAK
jgi:hypothetical protein